MRHLLNEKAFCLISNVRYSLLCWGRANQKCINDINFLINRTFRCLYYKKYDYIIRELTTQKKY